MSENYTDLLMLCGIDKDVKDGRGAIAPVMDYVKKLQSDLELHKQALAEMSAERAAEVGRQLGIAARNAIDNEIFKALIRDNR